MTFDYLRKCNYLLLLSANYALITCEENKNTLCTVAAHLVCNHVFGPRFIFHHWLTQPFIFVFVSKQIYSHSSNLYTVWFSCPFVASLLLFLYAFIHLRAPSCVHDAHVLIHSLMCPLVHSFIRSFVASFLRTFTVMLAAECWQRGVGWRDF